MRVDVIGTRGFPNIQGGVEKHCELLYPLIAAKGCKVNVYRRTPYVNDQNAFKKYRMVIFSDVWTLKKKNFETIFHSFLASLICLYRKPDIVHLHNIGPCVMIPLLKLGRLNTVVTYHSANYEHSKWGWLAKKVLKFGENFMIRWADKVIFVSKEKYESIACKKKVYLPNGVEPVCFPPSDEFLLEIGVLPGQYILTVGRLVPEKGIHDLVNAFKMMESDYKLVIAGDADYETDYSRQLRRMASEDDRIVLTGYITGEHLSQVYAHARLFVLPSYHEGLPIVVLEALSYGLSVLVSDIPANREIGLPSRRYFRCGDVEELNTKMKLLFEDDLLEEEREEMRKLVEEKYNWEKISEQTIAVYEEALE